MFIEPATYSKQSVSQFLGDDHDRLDSLLCDARKALAGGQVKEGIGLYSKFRSGLEQHMRMEEELLFPKFEELRGEFAHHGPTQAMRAEHREIRTLMRLIDDNLSAGEDPMPLWDALRVALESHNDKEEAGLYRLIDELAGSALASELVHRMSAL